MRLTGMNSSALYMVMALVTGIACATTRRHTMTVSGCAMHYTPITASSESPLHSVRVKVPSVKYARPFHRIRIREKHNASNQ
ncbi:MAG: hypothetical protein ACPG4U_07875 [Pseudomonadales bacterium]